jgi:excinuclease ABC subunit C
MQAKIVEEKLKILPNNPGCYLMKNRVGTIIYVGKAKVLKNRVRSYFTGAHNGKTQRLIEEIADFEIIVTKTEAEALILENQLIKANQPYYNVLLKDDKTYPYIAITAETHPRLLLTRTPHRKYYKLYGPYTSAHEARETMEILNYLYPFRKCVKLPNRLCLYYHIKQCLGPCVFDIDPSVYDTYIKEVTHFLRGNPQRIKQQLEQKMLAAADAREFEQAALYRNMIATVNNIFTTKGLHQNITQPTDVIGYAYNDSTLSVQIFHIRNGSIAQRESDVFVYQEDVQAAIENYIYQFYHSSNVTIPKDLFIPLEIGADTALADTLPSIHFVTPQRGSKKALLSFAMENAKKALDQKTLLAENKYAITLGATTALGELLAIPTPYHIEIIDTANLRNDAIVSGIVVFRNGRPSKKEYRKFNIKSTQAQDDYQALREVVYRRMYRNLMENNEMPDLLIVDGGIGHVNVAQEVLASLHVDIPLIGLSKNKQHRTNAIVTADGTSLPLKTTDNIFKLLARMQEEVHRFVINYHRKKRIQTSFSSALTKIPGIGEATRKKILTFFPHVNLLEQATIADLEQVVNKTQAQKIYTYYHKDKAETQGGSESE